MRGQLRANCHKDLYSDGSVEEVLVVQQNTLARLRQKINDGTDPAQVRRYCADVANFSAMIADMT